MPHCSKAAQIRELGCDLADKRQVWGHVHATLRPPNGLPLSLSAHHSSTTQALYSASIPTSFWPAKASSCPTLRARQSIVNRDGGGADSTAGEHHLGSVCTLSAFTFSFLGHVPGDFQRRSPVPSSCTQVKAGSRKPRYCASPIWISSSPPFKLLICSYLLVCVMSYRFTQSMRGAHCG